MAKILFTRNVEKTHPKMWYTDVGVVSTDDGVLYVIVKPKATGKWASFKTPYSSAHRVAIDMVVGGMNGD